MCRWQHFGYSNNLSFGVCIVTHRIKYSETSSYQFWCTLLFYLSAYCPIGSATFTQCAAGTYGPLTGQTSLSQCVACPIGTARGTAGADKLSQCAACAKGRYAPSTGVALFSNCGGGSFNNVTGIHIGLMRID